MAEEMSYGALGLQVMLDMLWASRLNYTLKHEYEPIQLGPFFIDIPCRGLYLPHVYSVSCSGASVFKGPQWLGTEDQLDELLLLVKEEILYLDQCVNARTAIIWLQP